MAMDKNKRISKGKKGGKKKVGDPFLKKEWYDVKAPSMFTLRSCGKTLVTKSQGTRLAVDGLKGRIFEVNLADLNGEEEQGFRKIKLCCEDVQGRYCLTDFAGLDMTRHHLCSLIRKWHTLVEAHVDAKTTDGYSLRMFCVGFSQRRRGQVKSTCYIQSSKVRQIRRRMVEVMQSQIVGCTLKELVQKFPHNTIEREILASCRGIFPLENIHVRKVKVLKKPKLDITKLMELHGDLNQDTGANIIEESSDARNLLQTEIAA